MTVATRNGNRRRRKVETALEWFSRSKQRKLRQNNEQSAGSRENGIDQKDTFLEKLPWWASLGDTLCPSESSSIATDPSQAANQFLWGGQSGIAPIDTAWKMAVTNSAISIRDRNNDVEYDYYSSDTADEHNDYRMRCDLVPPPPPPVVVLEGPTNVGKTWTLLSLAARFVVATRGTASTVQQNIDISDKSKAIQGEIKFHPLPEVILLDSSYDFTISQLVHVVRAELIRQTSKTYQHHQRQVGASDVAHAESDAASAALVCEFASTENCNDQTKIMSTVTALTRMAHAVEQRELQFERDLGDCLRRIHVVQVEDGSTDWVPVLEILRRQRAKRKLEQHNKASKKDKVSSSKQNEDAGDDALNYDLKSIASNTPTLLLWDGFLSDVATPQNSLQHGHVESAHARELRQQFSRLLEQESQYLWLVLTTTTAGNGSNGSRLLHQVREWIQHQDLQRHRRGKHLNRSTLHHRQICHVRMDRLVPRQTSMTSACYALVSLLSKSPTDNNGRIEQMNSLKIPYSLSTQGVLS